MLLATDKAAVASEKLSVHVRACVACALGAGGAMGGRPVLDSTEHLFQNVVLFDCLAKIMMPGVECAHKSDTSRSG